MIALIKYSCVLPIGYMSATKTQKKNNPQQSEFSRKLCKKQSTTIRIFEKIMQKNNPQQSEFSRKLCKKT